MTIGLGIGLGITIGSSGQGGGGGPVDPDRYMFFANRAMPPSGYPVDTTSLGGNTYFACKLKFHNPPYLVEDPWMKIVGFCMNEGLGPQETNNPANDVPFDGLDLIYNGNAYHADFSGTPGFTIVAASKGQWCSFPGLPEMAADSEFWLIPRWHVAAVGEKFAAAYRHQTPRGEKYWAAADAGALQTLIDTDADNTAILMTNYSQPPGNQTNSQIPCLGPTFMVAKGGWDGRPVVLVPSDSIGYGRQETAPSADERGNTGPIHRWLDAEEGGRIPHFVIGCPSSQSARELVAGSMMRWEILEEIKAMNGGTKYPFTVVLNQNVTNDSNTTLSTWKARPVGLISRLKTQLGADMPVLQVTCPPQNSTTLSFATAASISVSAPIWTTNRQSLNADIRNNAGFGHDGFIEMDLSWVDPDNPDKFMNATTLGQIGTCLSLTPGDGATSTSHPVGILDFEPGLYDELLFEYQPGLYAGRRPIAKVYNGDGTWTVTFYNNYATVFQANAKAYRAIGDGIHGLNRYYQDWVVPNLLARNEKAKLQV